MSQGLKQDQRLSVPVGRTMDRHKASWSWSSVPPEGWPHSDPRTLGVAGPVLLCSHHTSSAPRPWAPVPPTSTAREASARAWAGFLPNTCGKGRVPGVQRGGYFQPGPQGLLGPEQREAQTQDELPGPRLGKPSQF